ncbi:MAG: OsmC family protein [Chiayiivirga sp.]|jgi:organic hydroperoxide reductase OsmC/OhrA|uniref:OsmC family protein n=1 Tax=Chiayiivirga sp. TaxID=2041042 RepID=UPI0025C2F880|nr:OsmC family protein [Chiayiivirga sp.]MCI1728843.1 OsmC family protein [Chiayiivirga sp.]
MSEHRIALDWRRDGHASAHDTYSRAHTIRFSGGQALRNSSAPDYFGDAALANPEELLVAALSSCHMLTFLAVAAKRGFVVERYVDDAVGVLEKNSDGKPAVTRVRLRPQVEFGGEKQPDATELDNLHHKAHQHCIVANSVKTEVEVEH